MFQLGSLEQLLRLEHQHEDGSWSRLELRPSHHDPAEHDPERGWAQGRIYACTTCDEQVRVRDASSETGPGSAKP
jgi:hypothetical protein